MLTLRGFRYNHHPSGVKMLAKFAQRGIRVIQNQELISQKEDTLMVSYGCGKRCGVDMVYIGDGDWKCPTCGVVIPFGEPNDDDDDGESLSVWDAADIYLSNGFDEDYRFGYTHEELLKALGEK